MRRSELTAPLLPIIPLRPEHVCTLSAPYLCTFHRCFQKKQNKRTFLHPPSLSRRHFLPSAETVAFRSAAPNSTIIIMAGRPRPRAPVLCARCPIARWPLPPVPRPALQSHLIACRAMPFLSHACSLTAQPWGLAATAAGTLMPLLPCAAAPAACAPLLYFAPTLPVCLCANLVRAPAARSLTMFPELRLLCSS